MGCSGIGVILVYLIVYGEALLVDEDGDADVDALLLDLRPPRVVSWGDDKLVGRAIWDLGR